MELSVRFDHYVEVFDQLVPFQRSGQYELHRTTIERRRRHPDVLSALADDELLRLLRRTLEAWGIGRRASVLVPDGVFVSHIRAQAARLAALDGISCEERGVAIAAVPALWQLIRGLGVVENTAKVVAGTKTLHHLLPDLVPPMDRAWTGKFFGWTVADPQYRQEEIFSEAFKALIGVASEVVPSRLVGSGWRTSPSKLLDNAIIGYCCDRPERVSGGVDTPPLAPDSPAAARHRGPLW